MKTVRFIGVLMIAQSTCMACGLAFHYLYVNSAIRHQVESRLFDSLAQQAKQLADTAGKIGDRADKPDTARWHDLLAGAAKGDRQAMLLDQTGRVTFDSSGSSPTSGAITWTKASARWAGADGPIRGLINGVAGEMAAVAWPLPGSRGYVLVAETIDRPPIPMADLQSALRTAAALALVWTVGLGCAAMFLLASHLGGRASKPASADVENLKSSQALMRTQESVIFGLAKLSDSRDPDTGDHLERISYYSSTLAAALRQHPDFRNEVTPTFIRLIGTSSALHDIGKVGVEDAILRKPGALTPEERELMARHTIVGEECLREIERRLGTTNFLQMAREIAASHHERWDGGGYPQGLAGEQIPLAARIVAIADVYDALSSKRVYKLPLAHEQCVSTIAAEAGKHFDPRLVRVFLEIEANFRKINRHLQADESNAMPADEAAVGQPG